MKNIILFFAFTLLFTACEQGDPKTLYLIRHAEKDNYYPEDPSLTIDGVMRSVDLEKWFTDKPIDTLLSSDTKRTMETAKPLSEERGLEIGVYDPMKFEEVVKNIKQMKADTIVMIGHSNTILKQIEAFGIEKPQEEIAKEEYNKIFEVDLAEKKVTVHEYGSTYSPQIN